MVGWVVVAGSQPPAMSVSYVRPTGRYDILSKRFGRF
jgi:hypothetical protein